MCTHTHTHTTHTSTHTHTPAHAHMHPVMSKYSDIPIYCFSFDEWRTGTFLNLLTLPSIWSNAMLSHMVLMVFF